MPGGVSVLCFGRMFLCPSNLCCQGCPVGCAAVLAGQILGIAVSTRLVLITCLFPSFAPAPKRRQKCLRLVVKGGIRLCSISLLGHRLRTRLQSCVGLPVLLSRVVRISMVKPMAICSCAGSMPPPVVGLVSSLRWLKIRSQWWRVLLPVSELSCSVCSMLETKSWSSSPTSRAICRLWPWPRRSLCRCLSRKARAWPLATGR
ncbi:MAG: hypothetical protein BWY75_01350 [bacterium ADurb.Bin425]|nr:MAG: hypothetical protein BWY75_01350 [bacterium ADurb.Bin425]